MPQVRVLPGAPLTSLATFSQVEMGRVIHGELDGVLHL
jgi:hypothetical protein